MALRRYPERQRPRQRLAITGRPCRRPRMLAAKGTFRVFLMPTSHTRSRKPRTSRHLEAGADVAVACRVLPESRYLIAPSFIRYTTPSRMSRTFNWLVRHTLLPGPGYAGGAQGVHRARRGHAVSAPDYRDLRLRRRAPVRRPAPRSPNRAGSGALSIRQRAEQHAVHARRRDYARRPGTDSLERLARALSLNDD
jgi:hypothetical protein